MTFLRQHRLNFFPLPHGQGALRAVFPIRSKRSSQRILVASGCRTTFNVFTLHSPLSTHPSLSTLLNVFPHCLHLWCRMGRRVLVMAVWSELQFGQRMT